MEPLIDYQKYGGRSGLPTDDYTEHTFASIMTFKEIFQNPEKARDAVSPKSCLAELRLKRFGQFASFLLRKRHAILSFDQDISEMSGQFTRITKRADLLALEKTATKFPVWLTKQISPSDFRAKYEDLKERMTNTKKERGSNLITSNHALRRTSWPWHDSKNFKRDVPPLIFSALLEHYSVKHYREELLANSDAGALLRIQLNDELEPLGKPSSQLRMDESGKKMKAVTINAWEYPDEIKSRDLDAQFVQDSIIVSEVLREKAISDVVEDTKESIQIAIRRLESMQIAKLDPSKGAPINDGVARRITSLVAVSC